MRAERTGAPPSQDGYNPPMSPIVLALLVIVLAGVAALVVAWRAFLRLTAGAANLRERVDRLFLHPRRKRPLERDHYFKAYWQR